MRLVFSLLFHVSDTLNFRWLYTYQFTPSLIAFSSLLFAETSMYKPPRGKSITYPTIYPAVVFRISLFACVVLYVHVVNLILSRVWIHFSSGELGPWNVTTNHTPLLCVDVIYLSASRAAAVARKRDFLSEKKTCIIHTLDIKSHLMILSTAFQYPLPTGATQRDKLNTLCRHPPTQPFQLISTSPIV